MRLHQKYFRWFGRSASSDAARAGPRTDDARGGAAAAGGGDGEPGPGEGLLHHPPGKPGQVPPGRRHGEVPRQFHQRVERGENMFNFYIVKG